jgi:uncharacterized protein (TIGR02118 family)
MIRVSVYYPNSQGSTFDMKYYTEKHMPMVQAKLGKACRRIEVDQGVAGGPGQPAPWSAIGYLMFESVDVFQTAFGPHASAILADIPNYTNTQPVIQISEIKM